MNEAIEKLTVKLGAPKQSGYEYSFCCPYCHDTKHHLYINMSKMLYNCFKCGAKGTLQRLMLKLKISVGLLSKPAVITRMKLPQLVSEYGIVPVLTADRKKYATEIEYLETRGVFEGFFQRFAGVRHNSVYLFNDADNPVHFISRNVGGERNYHSKEDENKPIYFLKRAAKYPIIVISEGAFGAIAWSNIRSNVAGVALLGKTMSNYQFRSMTLCSGITCVTEFVIVLDCDVSFRHVYNLAVNLKRQFKRVSFIKMGTTDIDEIPTNERGKILDSRKVVTLANLLKLQKK